MDLKVLKFLDSVGDVTEWGKLISVSVFTLEIVFFLDSLTASQIGLKLMTNLPHCPKC